jgi:hypothetical protein
MEWSHLHYSFVLSLVVAEGIMNESDIFRRYCYDIGVIILNFFSAICPSSNCMSCSSPTVCTSCRTGYFNGAQTRCEIRSYMNAYFDDLEDLVMTIVAVLCVTVARAGTFALVRHIPPGNTWYRAEFVVFKHFLHL